MEELRGGSKSTGLCDLLSVGDGDDMVALTLIYLLVK